MRNPSQIPEEENTTFLAENIELITLHERPYHYFPKFDEGKAVVICSNPARKDYKRNNSLLARFKAFLKSERPPKVIALGIDQGSLDFTQGSDVVFTVTPKNGCDRRYEVVSHTVKEGQVKQPPVYTSRLIELLEPFRRRVSRLLDKLG